MSEKSPRERIRKFIIDTLLKNIQLLAILGAIVGMGMLATWPYQPRKIYLSENALSPHSMGMKFREVELVKNIIQQLQTQQNTKHNVLRTILEYEHGLEVLQSQNNTVAILRSERGPGKEALLLGVSIHQKEATALLVGLVLYLQKNARWLNKDIIVVFVEEETGIRHYLTRQQDFISTGRIAEAIMLDIPHLQFTNLAIAKDGHNGLQPCLDMVNVIRYIAERIHQPIDTHVTKNNYEFIAHDIWNKIASKGNGMHADARDFSIHALTLRGVGTNGQAQQNIIQLGRLLEGSIRVLNNLLEVFHHSYYLYLLLSPKHFMGFENYSPTMWCILFPIAVAAFGKLYDANVVAQATSFTQSGLVAGVTYLVTALILFTFEQFNIPLYTAIPLIVLLTFVVSYRHPKASQTQSIFYMVAFMGSIYLAATSPMMAIFFMLYIHLNTFFFLSRYFILVQLVLCPLLLTSYASHLFYYMVLYWATPLYAIGLAAQWQHFL